MTLSELAHYAHSQEIQFIAKGSINQTNAPPWYASFADISVNTETGVITINEMIGVHDVGTVINPDYVEGQIHGGVLQGVGQALSEGLTFNKHNGQPYVHELQNYLLPTSTSRPPIRAFTVEEDEPFGPFGAKGLGETPCIAIPGAIVNAVCNALGIAPERIEVPLSPERVVNMIKQSEAKFLETELQTEYSITK